MPKSLMEAISMDLNKLTNVSMEGKKSYLRYLLGVASLTKEGDTYTHEYAKRMGKEFINSEIRSYLYRGENILSYSQVMDAATERFFATYVQNTQNFQNTSSMQNKQKLNSFEEVMEKTITYYSNKFDTSNLDAVTKVAKMILLDYFAKQNIKVFSSKNGTREYVIGKRTIDLYNEVVSALQRQNNVACDNEEAVINLYASMVAKSWIEKKLDKQPQNRTNSIEDLQAEIHKRVNGINVNEAQKKWLLDEFYSGNIDALERYIPQQLIDNYKNLINNMGNNNYSM